MKFFPVEPEIDRQIESLMRQIRHLKDGETAEMIERSGARYRVSYGVSIVHLRKMAAETPVSTGLAIRLWARQVRETMILATMVVDFESLPQKEIQEWGEMLNTIELSEQMGRNLLADKKVPAEFLISWLKSEQFYKQYAATMAIGWRMRLIGDEGFQELPEILDDFKKLASEFRFMRAIGFVLKMAGRFSSFQTQVLNEAKEWQKDDNPYVAEVGRDVVFELEAFQ
ncbi:DNA alkylation repair protein [Marinilabilia sp.]|uniref:DNA alkylation repair protein n=1 Tax=Marinilabilia sp. TaxID=2021252 RepID=UPI0025C0AA0B|nr:DNA alkylation repair protein [Marinilabilia sp.]